jgi:hypothetical protein
VFRLTLEVPNAQAATAIAQIAEMYLISETSDRTTYEPDPVCLEKALEWLIARFETRVLPDVAEYLFGFNHEAAYSYQALADTMECCAGEIRRYVEQYAGENYP